VLADIARSGHANQAIGTAEALGLPFIVKPLRWGPLAAMPNRLLGSSLAGLAADGTADLAPPWPDLVVAAGRRTAPVARWLKAQSPACRCVQLMWPGSAAGLDLVIVPQHDRAAGCPGVASITAPPHRLSRERLDAAAFRLLPRLHGLRRPFIACLVGGSRRGARLSAGELARAASALACRCGGSLLVVTSRRTGRTAERTLHAGLEAPHRFHPFTGADDAIYAGVLGVADAVLVTADSASLVTEACATGRPVRLFRPGGRRLGKLERLHAALAPWLRPWDAPLTEERLVPLDSSGDAARLIRRLLEFSPSPPYVPPRRSMSR
jgi:mitochondrial fission protein ELM1